LKRENGSGFFPFIMPKPPLPARIRAYVPSDEKQVRFMVGQAQMESLAYANNQSTFFLPFPFVRL
jgi:hypothetical protein